MSNVKKEFTDHIMGVLTEGEDPVVLTNSQTKYIIQYLNGELELDETVDLLINEGN